jgi:opacity protein-like surface antigen
MIFTFIPRGGPASLQNMHFRRFLAFVLLFSGAASAFAGSDGKTLTTPIILEDPLAKGDTELEVLSGYFHSPITTGGGHRPEFDYAGADLRYGMVLSPILFDKCPLMRGDFEFLLDGFGEGVTEGPGTYLTGGSLLFRYNFFHPGSRFIPYFEAGGGGLHSDAAEDHSQRLIGSSFEFGLQADIGARFLLNDHWSILAEGGFQHISNADTAARNVGVNALGGRLGLGFIY